MLEIKLFSQIHSLKEISKGNYLIDMEIVSFDNNAIAPNIDFIIKAGSVLKNRTTNNEGFYRNDEFFVCKEDITEVELLDNDKNSISKYFLPFHISIETEELILKYKNEIAETKKRLTQFEKEKLSYNTDLEKINQDYLKKIDNLEANIVDLTLLVMR